jgi:hypothetical protein
LGAEAKNLERITRALETRDIYADPKLTKRRGYSELIHFKKDLWPKRLLLADEDHLRDFLVKNFSRIDEFDDLEDPEAEVRLERSGKQIDILCRERGTRAHVVIELKLDDGDQERSRTPYQTSPGLRCGFRCRSRWSFR